MNALWRLPIIISALLLGAHFLRAGLIPLVVLAVLSPLLLFFRHAWAARLVQIILALGTLEWIRALLTLVAERHAEGQPWTRLAIILGLVALLTGGSALLFHCTSLRAEYRLDHSAADDKET